MVKKKLIKQIPQQEPFITLHHEKPVFSFEYLQDVSIKGTNKDLNFLSDFLNHLREISRKSWKDINVAQKHSMIGYETLPLDAFVPQKFPQIVTPDVKKLMVFRATGDNRVFAGLKQNSIFYVIFIETKFQDVIKH